MKMFAKVLLACGVLGGVAMNAPAADRPRYVVVEPLCNATAHWNYNGGSGGTRLLESKLCGCEPLAWAHILTYHGMKGDVPAEWTFTPVTKTVKVGEATKSRTTGSAVTSAGETETWSNYTWGTDGTHAERLLYDLGILGMAQYQSGLTNLAENPVQKDDTTYNAETKTMSNDTILSRFYSFMNGKGWMYQPRPDFSYWTADFTEALLRGSLQAGAPIKVGTLKPLHAFICDGYGYDEDGTAYFHLNYGWGGSGNTWVSAAWFCGTTNGLPNISNCYINFQPEDVKCVVAGVVKQNQAPLGGVTVTLTGETLTEAKTAVTDARGAYAFTGLETESTYQVAANGTTQEVTTGKFVDEQLRAILQDELDKSQQKDPAPVEVQYGHAVADFNFEVPVQTSDALWAVWDDFSALTADAPLAPTVAFKVGDVDASRWRFKLNGGKIDGTALQTGTGDAPIIDFGESINLGWEHTPYTVIITVKDIATGKDINKPFWMAGSQIGFGLQTKSEEELIVEGMWLNNAYTATRWSQKVPTGSITFAVTPSSSYRAVVVGDEVTALGSSTALRGGHEPYAVPLFRQF